MARQLERKGDREAGWGRLTGRMELAQAPESAVWTLDAYQKHGSPQRH